MSFFLSKHVRKSSFFKGSPDQKTILVVTTIIYSVFRSPLRNTYNSKASTCWAILRQKFPLTKILYPRESHYNTKQRQVNGSFLVPLIGGRYHIIPQLAVYTTYIPLIVLAYWVIIYHRSHLLREPETAIKQGRCDFCWLQNTAQEVRDPRGVFGQVWPLDSETSSCCGKINVIPIPSKICEISGVSKLVVAVAKKLKQNPQQTYYIAI